MGIKKIKVTSQEAANIVSQLGEQWQNGPVSYEPFEGKDSGMLAFPEEAEADVLAADRNLTVDRRRFDKRAIVDLLVKQKKSKDFNEALAADPDAKLEWDTFPSFNINDGPVSQLLKKISLKL